jgi:hypothetical protein
VESSVDRGSLKSLQQRQRFLIPIGNFASFINANRCGSLVRAQIFTSRSTLRRGSLDQRIGGPLQIRWCRSCGLSSLPRACAYTFPL